MGAPAHESSLRKKCSRRHVFRCIFLANIRWKKHNAKKDAAPPVRAGKVQKRKKRKKLKKRKKRKKGKREKEKLAFDKLRLRGSTKFLKVLHNLHNVAFDTLTYQLFKRTENTEPHRFFRSIEPLRKTQNASNRQKNCTALR